MTSPESRSHKDARSLGLSFGVAIGTGCGVAIGLAWDKTHPPTS